MENTSIGFQERRCFRPLPPTARAKTTERRRITSFGHAKFRVTHLSRFKWPALLPVPVPKRGRSPALQDVPCSVLSGRMPSCRAATGPGPTSAPHCASGTREPPGHTTRQWERPSPKCGSVASQTSPPPCKREATSQQLSNSHKTSVQGMQH